MYIKREGIEGGGREKRERTRRRAIKNRNRQEAIQKHRQPKTDESYKTVADNTELYKDRYRQLS